jgi:CheY-like chemotaxis protein
VCRGTFDAMDAPWCSCLTTDRSLVCTRCLTCFCKALPAYKSHFWASAPKALWAQKFEENNSQPVVRENPSPETVIRPLVLVVEDEPAIQRVAARVVESLGYGLVTAKNGEEGLELAKRYKPDVVLSDALMPRMDGREMCRQLKENPETAGIKVVVMTSLYKSVKYRTEAQGRYRVDDYLVKPLDFNEVRGVLQKHVDSAVAPRLVSA